MSLAGLLLRRRRPVRGGFGGILRGPLENRIKPEPEPFTSLEHPAFERETAALASRAGVTTTRALQRGRPTTPNPPMAVRFVATEILSSADGLSHGETQVLETDEVRAARAAGGGGGKTLYDSAVTVFNRF